MPPEPPWKQSPWERLIRLRNLEQGWDSYGAHRIDPRAQAEAMRLMLDMSDNRSEIPIPVPTSDGGVSLEFNDESAIPILPDGSIDWEDMED